jgi:hypothetical protein
MLRKAQNKNETMWDWGCHLAVLHLSSMCKALGFIPAPQKHKKANIKELNIEANGSKLKVGTLARHVCNHSTQEAEAGLKV